MAAAFVAAADVVALYGGSMKNVMKVVLLVTAIAVLFCSMGCSSMMYKKFSVAESELQAAGLPVVRIQTRNGEKIQNKEDWIPATFEISNAPDESWNTSDLQISIRGRGNSTWIFPKKPYAIKFDKKTEVCGMPKHKRWVLIANYLDNSFMKNDAAFFMSNLLGMEYTVHGQFVNVVLNGNYVGLYWLGEQIKVDDNRVAIDEDTDFLIEMDSHYDEVWKFKTAVKNLPVQVKNDDSMTEERLQFLKDHINAIEQILYSPYFPYTDIQKTTYDDSFMQYIDIDSFAQFYLVNEIMYNEELRFPKSCYFTLKSDTGVLQAGPVWDFDWSSGISDTSLVLSEYLYYDALFKTKEFRTKLNELLADDSFSTEAVSAHIAQVRDSIVEGVELDSRKWGTASRNPVGKKFKTFDAYADNLEECINSRIAALKATTF